MIGTYKVVEITYLGNGECFNTDECEKNWIARLVKKKILRAKVRNPLHNQSHKDT